MGKKYTTATIFPMISEKDKYKLLSFKTGDKLMAKFFEGTARKPKIKECTFLENIDNKFLLVSLGRYKECITVRDLC